jgi:hypothetical protein
LSLTRVVTLDVAGVFTAPITTPVIGVGVDDDDEEEDSVDVVDVETVADGNIAKTVETVGAAEEVEDPVALIKPCVGQW